MESNPDSGSCCRCGFYIHVRISSRRMDTAKIWSPSSNEHIGVPAWRSNSLPEVDYQPDYLLPAVWHRQAHIPSATPDQCVNCSSPMVRSITREVIFCLRGNSLNGHGPIPIICTIIHECKRRGLADGMVLDGNFCMGNSLATHIDSHGKQTRGCGPHSGRRYSFDQQRIGLLFVSNGC